MMLIVAAEIALLLLVVCIFLVIQNRSLRKLVSQLKQKAHDLVAELKKARAAKGGRNSTPADAQQDVLSYLDHVDAQIQKTLDHHDSLNSNQDISLDIAPGIPLPHRTASLRHALLLAEKESISQTSDSGEPDWRGLRNRYDRIFSFLEDFADDEDASPEISAELQGIKDELDNARKRVKNLEKFKSLYFALEEKFQDSQKEAQTRYEDLSSMASEIGAGEKFDQALSDYHASYNGVAKIIEKESDNTPVFEGTGRANGESSSEVKHLRTVAADQHKIIEELQRKLREAKTESERSDVVEGLQDELQKQMRFVQESETCIQLLEDELNTVNADLEIMKSKLNKLPQVKSEVVNLRKQLDETDLKYHSAVSENRKLQKKLKEAMIQSRTANNDDAARLRKELTDLETKYNELEEKFLDLKLQQ